MKGPEALVYQLLTYKNIYDKILGAKKIFFTQIEGEYWVCIWVFLCKNSKSIILMQKVTILTKHIPWHCL